MIARFGGPEGIRDPGLLEAALYRPQTGYYDDIIETAAVAAWLGSPTLTAGLHLLDPTGPAFAQP